MYESHVKILIQHGINLRPHPRVVSIKATGRRLGTWGHVKSRRHHSELSEVRIWSGVDVGMLAEGVREVVDGPRGSPRVMEVEDNVVEEVGTISGQTSVAARR